MPGLPVSVPVYYASCRLLSTHLLPGNTPLLEAVKCGHVDIVEELLKNGSNPKIINNGGDSALHMAAFDGNLSLVKVSSRMSSYSWIWWVNVNRGA